MGDIVARALKKAEIFVHTYREYPSIIKGGSARMQIDAADHRVLASTRRVGLVAALNREEVAKNFSQLEDGGWLVHFVPNLKLTPEAEAEVANRNLRLLFLPALDFLKSNGLDILFVNAYLMGAVWRLLGQPVESLESQILEKFAKKPAAAEKNAACLRAGFESASEFGTCFEIQKLANPDAKVSQQLLIDGTKSAALGLIASGTRAHFAYPMSPSSGILAHLGRWSGESGMLVKQAEDEITAINMAIGANHAGTRASTATSGGGYDLMTEGMSLASITETPVLVVLCQRPGPGTGLPTWTSQGDLQLAVFAGHGDNPKIILALSDPSRALPLIARAWNLAEKYQIPAIVLADKWLLEDSSIAEIFSTDGIAVERGKLISDPAELASLTSLDRYRTSDADGVSPRWLPGAAGPTWNANSDEHDGAGAVVEDAEPSQAQMDKRARKLAALRAADSLEPELFGSDSGELLFVGWGSSKLAMLDAQASHPSFSYLHFEQLWPLDASRLRELAPNFKKVVLVEGNMTGQLGELLAMTAEFAGFHSRILKYNGRPFFADEIAEHAARLISES